MEVEEEEEVLLVETIPVAAVVPQDMLKFLLLRHYQVILMQ
jgi:hypothetical protein